LLCHRDTADTEQKEKRDFIDSLYFSFSQFSVSAAPLWLL